MAGIHLSCAMLIIILEEHESVRADVLFFFGHLLKTFWAEINMPPLLHHHHARQMNLTAPPPISTILSLPQRTDLDLNLFSLLLTLVALSLLPADISRVLFLLRLGGVLPHTRYFLVADKVGPGFEPQTLMPLP